MPVFSRRKEPPPPAKHYRRYRPFVREDFSQCCAYCLICELLAGGKDNFELDHFRPKSISEFESLVNDFYNIYYSCHVCNHYKSNIWPTPELLSSGYHFIDLCIDRFSEHFDPQQDGTWKPLTPAADYTSSKLRLNRRHLVVIRALLHDILRLQKSETLDWDVPIRDDIEHFRLTLQEDDT